ncbi:MAG: DUF4157 domain-containing protein [Candidatus Entotheonellia bacterium]
MHEVLSSPSEPLDAETHAFFEPRFGHDFSRVRVHTDARAAAAAREVTALAFTVGSDIVFGAGQHAPGTMEGRRLLAHELAHTIQQSTNPRLGVQRYLAGGCSDNPAHDQAVGEVAHRQVQAHASENFRVDIEGRIPRATADLTDQSCLPDYDWSLEGPGHGRADLYKIMGHEYKIAEIKPFGPVAERVAREQFSHYAGRVNESVSRLRNEAPCFSEQVGEDDRQFNREYFLGRLEFGQRVFGSPMGHDIIGPGYHHVGLLLYPTAMPKWLEYYNSGDGAVIYQCTKAVEERKRQREEEKKQEVGQRTEETEDEQPPQLELPFRPPKLRAVDPLVREVIPVLEPVEVPPGPVYPVLVPEPFYEGLEIARHLRTTPVPGRIDVRGNLVHQFRMVVWPTTAVALGIGSTLMLSGAAAAAFFEIVGTAALLAMARSVGQALLRRGGQKAVETVPKLRVIQGGAREVGKVAAGAAATISTQAAAEGPAAIASPLAVRLFPDPAAATLLAEFLGKQIVEAVQHSGGDEDGAIRRFRRAMADPEVLAVLEVTNGASGLTVGASLPIAGRPYRVVGIYASEP